MGDGECREDVAGSGKREAARGKDKFAGAGASGVKVKSVLCSKSGRPPDAPAYYSRRATFGSKVDQHTADKKEEDPHYSPKARVNIAGCNHKTKKAESTNHQTQDNTNHMIPQI